MRRYIQRALKDLRDNRFLSTITVITIALSVLIAASFALFFVNAGEVLRAWQKDIRMMVYLKTGTSEAARLDTKYSLQTIAGVQEARYISREEALAQLTEQMKHHAALLKNLKSNPLPDAFEISLLASVRSSTELEFLAERILALPAVAEVEYGQQWIQRFTSIIRLFSLAGYAIGGLFFMATLLIVANTIRLVLYSRRDEIEIMRLVGATDRFIKIPFYVQGMLQGGAGSLAGLLLLYAGFFWLNASFGPNAGGELLTVRFFAPRTCAGIVLAGVLVGWLGCLMSIRQFMKG